MDKNTNMYVQQLLKRGASSKELSEEEKDKPMQGFYVNANQLEDIRGIAVVKQEGIKGAPHFGANPYFKPGSSQQHNEEDNEGRRKYHSEHAKFYTRMLEKTNPKRWNLIKERRFIEAQKEDISGLILDLLGPDNRSKYDDCKQNTKYEHFTPWQRILQEQITKRIAWIAEPLEEAVEMLSDTVKNNPTNDVYRQDLQLAAAFLHEKLYPESYK